MLVEVAVAPWKITSQFPRPHYTLLAAGWRLRTSWSRTHFMHIPLFHIQHPTHRHRRVHSYHRHIIFFSSIHHHPISFVYMASFRHYLASAWHRKQDLPYIHISSIFPSIHIPAPRSPYLTALASSVSALASYYDIHPHSIPHMHRRRSSILCIPDPFIPVYHRIDIILASP